jgi:hypothetical protein
MLGTHSLALFATTGVRGQRDAGRRHDATLTQTLRHGVRGGWRRGGSWPAASSMLAAALGCADRRLGGGVLGLEMAGRGLPAVAGVRHAEERGGRRGRGPGAQPPGSRGAAALFRQGVLTNVLNPKIALFFLALLPQFIDADAPSKTLAFLFLGAWFVVQGGIFLFAFVFLVAPLRRWQAGGVWKRGLNAAGAGLFAWLAVRLAFAERA